MTKTQAKYETKRYCGNCGLRVDGICTLTGAEQIECLSGDERTHWTPWKHTESTNSGTGHARTCRCDTCLEYWERQQVEPDRIDTIKKNNHGVDVHEMVGGPRPEDVADALAYGIAGMDFARSAWQKKGDIETDYRPDSLVSRKKARIKELVDAHWSYMEKTLTAGQDKGQMFSWDQVMEMRKWDYTSAATHFYGHGYEDGQNESE